MRKIILVLIFFITLTVSLSSINNPVESQSLLVSTEWLQENLNLPELIILNVGTRDKYEEKHIPGARLISMRALIVETENLSHEIPPMAIIDSIFNSVGINANSKIVIVYENDMLIPVATRLYLTLDYAGLGNNTYILNGGLTKWENENRLVSNTSPNISAGNYSIKKNEQVFVDADWILNNLRNPDFSIIDARPVEQYEGREEESEHSRPGHIQGAVNIEFFKITYEEKPHEFKDDFELEKLFENAGVMKGSTVVVYCGTGIWGCNIYLIAKHLGYNVRFYDASYQEWSENEELPVTRPVSLD